ncbi:hypothetical protein [Qipengyuania sediminis]|uniref:hypothetical protein n=1 Tax=Qipengyuania sediminis TaxID=1532023 RepID=UPI0010592601|nr:hypothetical protein [Qipengyuania sediminis]
MRLSPRYNPAGGIADFWQQIRRPTPYRWPILGLSLLSTFGLMFWLTQERVFITPPPPKVSFISTLEPGRSDTEIIAANLANQERKERLAAEQAARDEKVKDAYRALGRATGLDVDAMERRIAEERRAEAAAAEAARAGTAAGIAPAAQ